MQRHKHPEVPGGARHDVKKERDAQVCMKQHKKPVEQLGASIRLVQGFPGRYTLLQPNIVVAKHDDVLFTEAIQAAGGSSRACFVLAFSSGATLQLM